MELPPEVKKEMEEEEEVIDDTEGEGGDQEKTKSSAGEKDQGEVSQTAQSNVLNLNNEVVKMRKEVKRVRALIIRRLTRQIAVLKKKKGKDIEVERNQRRAARLLEEIHAIKGLAPDLVTKTALQKNLNFEKVCKNPKSTISDRAIARIATHLQFSKRIEGIKAAVKAFKEERVKGGKCGGKFQDNADNLKKPPHTDAENVSIRKEKEDKPAGPNLNNKQDTVEASHDEPSLSISKVNLDENLQKYETSRTDNRKIKQTPVKRSEVKDTVKTKQQSQSAEKIPTLKLTAEVLPKAVVEAESDLEPSDDDEKQYFDDSTEERFHRQSSTDSEESDNGFFLGKVSKYTKKRKNKSDKVTHEVKENSNTLLKADKVQSELDELESRLKSKAPLLKSAFCPSLAGPKQSHGKGAGKNDSKFGGQAKQKGSGAGNKDFSRDFKFQKGVKAKDSGSKYSKPFPGDMHPEKEEKSIGRGRGRGWGQGREHVIKPNDARGRSVFSHQTPQQPLHPSWEASKKRKEQQGQILAFQGKKIKFDD